MNTRTKATLADSAFLFTDADEFGAHLRRLCMHLEARILDDEERAVWASAAGCFPRATTAVEMGDAAVSVLCRGGDPIIFRGSPSVSVSDVDSPADEMIMLADVQAMSGACSEGLMTFLFRSKIIHFRSALLPENLRLDAGEQQAIELNATTDELEFKLIRIYSALCEQEVRISLHALRNAVAIGEECTYLDAFWAEFDAKGETGDSTPLERLAAHEAVPENMRRALLEGRPVIQDALTAVAKQYFPEITIGSRDDFAETGPGVPSVANYEAYDRLIKIESPYIAEYGTLYCPYDGAGSVLVRLRFDDESEVVGEVRL